MKTKGWFNRKARNCWHQQVLDKGEILSWIKVGGLDPSFGKMWYCVQCNQRWYLY